MVAKLEVTRNGDLLADAAHAHLSEAILRNELAPGAPLSVPDLSRQLNISRSPVREAVQRLVHDGLADYRGRSGTFVSSIDVGDFVALLEVREVLEGLAAQLASQRATGAQLAEFSEVNRGFSQLEPGDSASVELDMAFHQLIREMAANEELGTVLGRAQARAHLSMHTLWSGSRNVEAVQAEHSAICAAIIARDGHAADAAARSHIAGLRHRVLREVASLAPSGSTS